MPADRELLDAFFAHAPLGLGHWDRQLRYQRVNETLAAINGFGVDEHPGRTLSELLGSFGEAAERTLRGVLESGEPLAGLEVVGETPAAPGEERRWLASYFPVRDADDEVVGVAAAVVEVTDRHHTEAERLRLLKAAVTARAHAEAAQIRAETAQREAEAARARIEFLFEAGERMATSMDLETTLQRVAEVAVPAIADSCAITVLQPGGELRTVAVAYDSERGVLTGDELGARERARLEDVVGAERVVRTGRSELATGLTDDKLKDVARDPEHLDLLRSMEMRASLVVPLRTPERVIGTVSFAMSGSGRDLGEDDASLATELATRAALHIRNAQLYAERSHIARTLQAGLLPQSLPAVPGLDIAARYQAAGDQNDVGGDFYDVFPSRSGVWTALMGDVTGKGPEAAALTSLVRHTLRTAALFDERPSNNLHLLNRAMLGDARSNRFCTVAYGRICRAGDGVLVTLATGGHPPPLILRGAGTLEPAPVAGSLVGGVEDPVFTDVDVRLERGDLLLMYTDGVTELRTRDPRFGERLLARTLLAHAGAAADDVVEAVLRAAVEAGEGPPRDDIALLALRVP